MVLLFLTAAQAAVCWSLILISEQTYASPVSSNLSGIEVFPILTRNIHIPSARGIDGVEESNRELEYSYASLLKGFEKYAHVMESLHKSCEPFVRLHKVKISKYGTHSAIKVVTGEKPGQINIVEAGTKDPLGKFIYPFRGHCLRHKRRKMKRRNPLKLGFESLEVTNGQVYFKNALGVVKKYNSGASFAKLKRIVEDGKLLSGFAKLMGGRNMKIEFAIEDEINQKYIIFINDYERPAYVGKLNMDRTIDNKTMAIFMLTINDKSERKTKPKVLLSQPVLNKSPVELTWNSLAKKYELKEIIKTHW